MKKIVLVMCSFIVICMVACSFRTHKFEIGDAAKIIVSSGTTGTQVEITDTENIQYITDNINGLTYSKGEKVNSDGWSYALIWYDKDGNEMKKLTVLNEYTVIFEGCYYKGTEVDYEIDLTFLEKLFEEYGK